MERLFEELPLKREFFHAADPLEKSEIRPLIKSYLEELKKIDSYTYHHSFDVAQIASKYAYYRGHSHEELLKILYAGLIHDIGKINIEKKYFQEKAL